MSDLAYLNGRFLPAEEARLAVYDAGVVQGATVSELTRTFQLLPFRLDHHLARLFRSLEYAGIDAGISPEELKSIAAHLIEHNGRTLPAGDDLGIIHFVTAGEYSTYAP